MCPKHDNAEHIFMSVWFNNMLQIILSQIAFPAKYLTLLWHRCQSWNENPYDKLFSGSQLTLGFLLIADGSSPSCSFHLSLASSTISHLCRFHFNLISFEENYYFSFSQGFQCSYTAEFIFCSVFFSEFFILNPSSHRFLYNKISKRFVSFWSYHFRSSQTWGSL